MNNLNWSALSYGPLTRDEITIYVNDTEWQSLRLSLVGMPSSYKYHELARWLKRNRHDRASQVQVTNYINALKRGGLVK